MPLARTAALLLALCLLAGTAFQFLENRRDAYRHPEPGRLVDAGNGLRLQLHCTGSGAPTVILEAGLGDTLSQWRLVQPIIARRRRVCSYDHAGYGGSTEGQMPRTSAQIAKELHELLQNAGERPPFVLVGSSFGGFSVRAFAGGYPEETIAMVLVDSTQENQYQLLPAAWKELWTSQLNRYRSQARWASAYVGLGAARLQLLSQGGLNEDAYLIFQPKYLRARASELEFIRTSAQQAHDAGSLGSMPLIVLTAGKHADVVMRQGLTQNDIDEFQRVWVDDLQIRLTRLSAKGERRMVLDSGHDIPGERPDVVAQAVEDVCSSVGRR